MSLPRSLRQEFLKHRKRKQISLDGTVAGIEPARYRGGYEYAGQQLPQQVAPSQADDYLGRLADQYEPHPGWMEVPQPEYDAYTPAMPTIFTPLHRDAPSPTRPVFPEDEAPSVEHLMTTESLADLAMREGGSQIDSEGPVPYDNPVTANELLHSPASLDQIAGAQPDPITEIEQAIGQQMAEPFAAPQPMPEPEPDPWEVQRQMYDEQMRPLMDPFGMPGMMGPRPMM
ncbi:MAG: hypothetical protein JXA69_04145 [Phycisphaerae bacterium]|nr:hypothetical protein [Phycisphaerae bacterium]